MTESAQIDERYVDLAGAILANSVADWQSLKYGEVNARYRRKNRTEFITRDEMLRFWYSEWFEFLLESISTISPDEIREYLHVPECVERLREEGRGIYGKHSR